MDKMGEILPVILSGGAGTRLWPLSRRAYPKQFLNLNDELSPFQQTVKRVDGPTFAKSVVLCADEHRFIVADQLRQLGENDVGIILEPVARDTAPAALIAALVAAETHPDAMLLLMPSDHVIDDNESFHRAVISAMAAASEGNIVTFGVTPKTPETGYGYIETGVNHDVRNEEFEEIFDICRFVEKPGLDAARNFLSAGNYLWNSGIFLATGTTLIRAFRTHAPQLLKHCIRAHANATRDLDFIRLERAAYDRCENISLDYAIMEKAENLKCVQLRAAWKDLGTWSAIWQQAEKDDNGNVLRGDVVLHNVKNSYVHNTTDICLGLIGLDDVTAVATGDAVLLAAMDEAQNIPKIVDELAKSDRSEAVKHRREYRPWGWYEGISLGNNFKIKCLMVKPGEQLSLQTHAHRAETWIVISGTVDVTLQDRQFRLVKNESTHIPIGALHRLGNSGANPALLIEVQTGSYLSEDDIIRYLDDYNRSDGNQGTTLPAAQ